MPIKQPLFHGKYPAGVFFFVAQIFQPSQNVSLLEGIGICFEKKTHEMGIDLGKVYIDLSQGSLVRESYSVSSGHQGCLMFTSPTTGGSA